MVYVWKPNIKTVKRQLEMQNLFVILSETEINGTALGENLEFKSDLCFFHTAWLCNRSTQAELSLLVG